MRLLHIHWYSRLVRTDESGWFRVYRCRCGKEKGRDTFGD